LELDESDRAIPADFGKRWRFDERGRFLGINQTNPALTAAVALFANFLAYPRGRFEERHYA
jgi:hypothetical protein